MFLKKWPLSPQISNLEGESSRIINCFIFLWNRLRATVSSVSKYAWIAQKQFIFVLFEECLWKKIAYWSTSIATLWTSACMNAGGCPSRSLWCQLEGPSHWSTFKFYLLESILYKNQIELPIWSLHKLLPCHPGSFQPTSIPSCLNFIF